MTQLDAKALELDTGAIIQAQNTRQNSGAVFSGELIRQ